MFFIVYNCSWVEERQVDMTNKFNPSATENKRMPVSLYRGSHRLFSTQLAQGDSYLKGGIMRIVTVVWLTCAVAVLVLIMALPAKADNIPDSRAINAIIGEAENQGYIGMVAIGCAIRNRGTLKGVYGENASRVVRKKYSANTYELAKKAWAESATHDITYGANHWENTTAFGVPSWSKKMKKTFSHKDHTFWRS